MKISLLLNDLVSITVPDIEINGIALDSRLVKPGNLFFACLGTQQDGRQFIDQAIQAGAAAIVSEGSDSIQMRGAVPIIFISDLGHKLGMIAARFYHHPSQKMHIVGITGTNGKTSCSHFIAEALTRYHLPCGVIGTLGSGLYGHLQESSLTTPDAITLQKTLAEFLNQKAQYVAMEVSSHSIDQGRMNGIDFDIGILTNLSRDHLDYHGTMENYAAAKTKFFAQAATETLVVNADDELGQKIITTFQDKKPIYAYSTTRRKLPLNIHPVYVTAVQLDHLGMHGIVHSPWGEGELAATLIGQFNLQNILAALTTLCLLNIPFAEVLKLISQLHSVPGRMQIFGGGGKPLVVVDYAHTPDALEKVLQALRHHCQGKLICVFGCGGDRDRGKRPLMASIAEKLADAVIVTNDNPRQEEPAQIFKDIFAGFLAPDRALQEPDRALAIRQAIELATIKDCILIAGKGAEAYQIIGQKKYHFNDVEEVLRYL